MFTPEARLTAAQAGLNGQSGRVIYSKLRVLANMKILLKKRPVFGSDSPAKSRARIAARCASKEHSGLMAAHDVGNAAAFLVCRLIRARRKAYLRLLNQS
jgi:hypothetical protein